MFELLNSWLFSFLFSHLLMFLRSKDQKHSAQRLTVTDNVHVVHYRRAHDANENVERTDSGIER